MKKSAGILICLLLCLSLLPTFALGDAAAGDTAATDSPVAGGFVVTDDTVGPGNTAQSGDVAATNNSIAAPAQDAHEITCKISTSEGDSTTLIDRNIRTYWQNQSADATATLIVPDDETPAYLRIDWFGECDSYTISEYDAAGNLTRTQDQTATFRGIQLVYSLDPETKRVVITLPIKESWIGELYVYSQGTLPDDVHVWTEPYDDVDMMVIAAHQDDEYVFFSGTIPYSIANGYKTICAYMTSCGRFRRAEALNGLWAVGMRNYPEFINNPDKNPDSVNELSGLWSGEDNVLSQLVRVIRRYKPEVIVTHDVNGEYGHPAHKLTAKLIQQAVLLAADPEKYADSANEYGAFQVQKLYLHLYDQNQIVMDFTQPLSYYGGKTAIDMAKIGYDAHASQHEFYSVNVAGDKYDGTKFGLAYTSVGNDVNKNDFFENVVLVTPTPEPVITPEPTATPEPTVAPTPTPEPGLFDKIGGSITGWLLAGLGGLIALGGAAVGVMALLRRRKNDDDPDDDGGDDNDDTDGDDSDDDEEEYEEYQSGHTQQYAGQQTPTKEYKKKQLTRNAAPSGDTQVYSAAHVRHAVQAQVQSQRQAQPEAHKQEARQARPQTTVAARSAMNPAQPAPRASLRNAQSTDTNDEYTFRPRSRHDANN